MIWPKYNSLGIQDDVAQGFPGLGEGTHRLHWSKTGNSFSDGDKLDFFVGKCPRNNRTFTPGLDLSIHIRTKIRYEFSFVQSAAIQVGEDILEVAGFGEYDYNDDESADLAGAHLTAIQLSITLQTSRKMYLKNYSIGNRRH
jgi:hypothetical protein